MEIISNPQCHPLRQHIKWRKAGESGLVHTVVHTVVRNRWEALVSVSESKSWLWERP